MRNLLLCCVTVWLVACGDDDQPSMPDAGGGDAGPVICEVDEDCSDGVFCNGVERCAPNHTQASAEGCLAGPAPRCDDHLACTVDTCSHLINGCRFVPIDADGDGHAAASCMTEQGESLGDDCDDQDANRFPGNTETCTADTETHDEDCNPSTFGLRDVDGDAVTDDSCCNGTVCGDDCDDSERRIGPNYAEVCDRIDNDCDGRVDVDTVMALWYPDDDGDGFGHHVDDPVESCAPVDGHSLFDSDLNDTNAALNPAAIELCDGLDNDCDTQVDEREVCTCGVPGAEPCECVAGSVDCLGELIPRSCVRGFWVAGRTCSGVTPYCVGGECVCTDGTRDCTEVVDGSPPFVLGYWPAQDSVRVPIGAGVAVALSEAPAASSINATNFRVTDIDGVAVPGRRTIDGQTVVFNSDALLPGHIYDVTFANVTDRAGNPMRNTLQWRFATELGDYPREVILELGAGLTGGFAQPALRVSSGGDAAVWVDASWSCGDCISQSTDIFQRQNDGTWSSTGWTSSDRTPVPFAVSETGRLAGFFLDVLPMSLLRRGPSDTSWDVLATGYSPPAAIAASGDTVVTAAMTTVDVTTFLEVATATGTAAPTPVAGLPLITTASEVALDTLPDGTIALAITTGADLTVALYTNGSWNVRTIPTSLANAPAVKLHANGTAVVSFLQLQEIQSAPGGPLQIGPVHHVAFFDAMSTTLLPHALMTRTTHSAPQVAWRDDATVIASHSEPGPVVKIVATDGTILATQLPQGALDGTAGSATDLTLLPNGDAIATWVQSNSSFGPSVLVAVRYVDGAWLPAEAIVENPVAQLPQIEALPDNTALLLWAEAAPTRGVAIVLP